MKILNISSNDIRGGRFNGFDIQPHLSSMGHEVGIGSFWNHESSEPWSYNIFPGHNQRLLAEGVRAIEVVTGRQATLQWWSKRLLQNESFISADIIHLQIINDHYLRFELIKEIARLKPTVWTWHDLWPATGHCLTPTDCPRWASGCGKCPDLSIAMPVLMDRTAAEFKRKHAVLREIELDVHVSTNWMRERVEKHLEGTRNRLHVFPFGIDLERFKPISGDQLRSDLGIRPSDFVVFARSTSDRKKSFNELVAALERLSSRIPIVLLTVQDYGIAEKITTNLRIVEFPWINDPDALIALYSVCDVFAMPSKAESFGFMALEAMACGKCVVAVEGTATAEIVDSAGLLVPLEDLEQHLEIAFEQLASDPDLVLELGRSARTRAERFFGLRAYLKNLDSLYKKVTNC